MCTAISFSNGSHYFGRNLDLEYSYNETVTITPRSYPFQFRCGRRLDTHFALIGMAYICDDYPLYYDATNEKGLSMAGLNFPGNAIYMQPESETLFLGPFEIIPWMLGVCTTVAEVKEHLEKLVIADVSFSKELPASPLHWIAADQEECITIEAVADGVKVYDNPVGVLTNNPTFDYHMLHLTQYLNLTSEVAQNRFSGDLDLKPFSKGMGGIGLPGDLSSPSRFVRAAFTMCNSRCDATENENVSQFFHVLGSVEQQRGCAQVHDELYEITRYTSCCNTEKGIYYYRTYSNSQISAVCLHHAELNAENLYSYPLITEQQILFQN